MLGFLLLTAVTVALGIALLGVMYTRHDPFYGALGLMALCVAGVTSAAYGVLHSAA